MGTPTRLRLWVALVVVLALGPAPAAWAHDVGTVNDEISVTGARDYDPTQDTTAFSFLVESPEPFEAVLILACPGAPGGVASAVGPPGTRHLGLEPQPDPQTGHAAALRFEPGAPGSYAVAYHGPVQQAELVVVTADGHRHFPAIDHPCTVEADRTPTPGGAVRPGDPVDRGAPAGRTEVEPPPDPEFQVPTAPEPATQPGDVPERDRPPGLLIAALVVALLAALAGGVAWFRRTQATPGGPPPGSS